MTNCVIWARVSSREQQEGYSIDAQLRLMRDRAANDGWTIVREFIVAESARRGSERIVFNQMLRWMQANAAKHQVEIVLAHKLDRICRNIRDAVRMQELEDTCGVKMAFVDNHFGPGAAGAFSFNVMAAVAQYYSDNLRQEVLKGIEEKVHQGWVPGLAPFGYINTDNRDTPIQPHTENAKAVQRIFELYSSGTRTFEEIRDIMKLEGFIYRQSQPRFGRTAMSYILNNPVYAGMIRFRGQLYAGKHRALISQTMFDECQELLKRKNRRGTGKRLNRYLAGGLFTCAHCGFSITSERVTRRMKSGHVHEYIYYRCGNTARAADHTIVRWREDRLEQAIIASLKKLQASDGDLRWCRQVFVTSCAAEMRLNDDRVKKLRRRLTEIDTKRQRLLDVHLHGQVDRSTFARKDADLTEEEGDVRGQLQASEQQAASSSQEMARIWQSSRAATERWQHATPIQRRELLDAMFVKRTLSEAGLRMTPRPPFDHTTMSDTGQQLVTGERLTPMAPGLSLENPPRSA
jgi:DNA invertase Pin-like site-specific DNA recombinase